MIDLLQQQEAPPEAYPDAPSGLSDEAAAVSADMLWQRIESYIAHRFTAREIVWTISGFAEDEWQAPIVPLVSHTAQKWDAGAWVSATLTAGPVGLCLPSDGTFKITAQVGGGDLPAAVSEAFRRLAEYSAEITDDNMMTGHPSHTTHSAKIGSAVDESFTRYATWAARALQLSGAADLLRPYRRA